jgi:SAM-dependent methyltransferase
MEGTTTLSRLLRSLRGVRLDDPLPPAACLAALELMRPLPALIRGGRFRCPLRLRNLGTHAWSSRGRRPVVVSARWLTAQAQPLPLDESRLRLPGTLPAGATAALGARLRAPDSLGDYLLEIDLVQEPDTRFAAAGSRPLTIPCHVTGRRRDDIDYRRWYARHDLDRDWWTIVGPASRAEYERLGAVKLGLLRDLGLRPDSRVLDVGCGTGLLAAALEGFLDERGRYCGTDLGAEAIAFCRDRFRRRNFAFLVNEPTALPLRDEVFDFVVFYSVFTHTFPDETARLLSEARRLLAEGGLIFADLFVSPLVSRWAGNRGAVEVNREHFLALAADRGLRAEVVLDQSWQRFARRLFFRLVPEGERGP